MARLMLFVKSLDWRYFVAFNTIICKM